MSQVNPGFTDGIKYLKVETLILAAIERATNPERIIVGTYDGNSFKQIRTPDNFKTVKLFMRYQKLNSKFLF